MLAQVLVTNLLLVGLALPMLAAPVAAAEVYVDDFPSALSNYTTGGWQGPFGDGTLGGTVVAGPDNWTVYMDATYNALAYAFRRTPDMYDFSVTVDFVVPTRDFTPGDQLAFDLRWKNPTYPDPAPCNVCTFPTAESGIHVDFFLGEGRVFVSELGENETVSRPFSLAIGRAHEARIELSGTVGRVYLDGTQLLVATNLTSPPGLFGIQAYREDVILDKIRIDLIRTSPSGSSNPLLLTQPFALLVLLFAAVLIAFVALGWWSLRTAKAAPPVRVANRGPMPPQQVAITGAGYCIHCGTPLQVIGQRFCRYCGADTGRGGPPLSPPHQGP